METALKIKFMNSMSALGLSKFNWSGNEFEANCRLTVTAKSILSPCAIQNNNKSKNNHYY